MTFVDIFTHVVNYMPSFNTQQAAGNLPQGIKAPNQQQTTTT